MNGKSTGLLRAVVLMKKEITRKIIVMIGENIMDYNNIYNFKNPIRDRFKFCVN